MELLSGQLLTNQLMFKIYPICTLFELSQQLFRYLNYLRQVTE